jgi:glycerol uptake facilitator-like aquaporin
MQAESSLIRRAGKAAGRFAATVVIAYVLANAARYGLVERDDLGAVCQSSEAPAWCDVRMLIIQGFLNDVFGRSSVALAALSAWRRSAVAAHLAVAVGTFGMVLYGFTWSGVGVLGGALVLARLQGQWQQDR